MSRVVQHGDDGNRFLPVILWLVRARMTSCLVCGVLWLAVNGVVRSARTAGHTHWQRASWVATAWLIGTVVAVYGVGVYVPSLPRSEDIAAFMGFGLLAEELLFRGAIFSLCCRVFPTHATLPIVWTAVLFGLQHLQYHHAHAGAPALTQIAYTIPMGLVLGYVRSATQRLGPCVFVHLLNNAVTLTRVT